LRSRWHLRRRGRTDTACCCRGHALLGSRHRHRRLCPDTRGLADLAEQKEDSSGEHAAHQRSDQEQPELTQRQPADHDGRTEASGGVDRRTVNRNTHDVDQGQRDAHGGASRRSGCINAGGTQYHEHQHCGQHYLDQERATS